MAKKLAKKIPKGCKYEGVLDPKTGLITWKSHGNQVTPMDGPPPPPPVLPGPK